MTKPTNRTRLAQYQDVDASYLENRKLQKHAGWVLLWALGVGAVISGDFFGWNYGLVSGGFWGLAIATVLMAIMYVCMVYSIAELSAALPHAGGFYSFTRSALGPFGGFVCGVTDTIEYVITPAVIVVGIGGYMNALVPGVPPYAWWFISYALFIAINIRGVALTLKVGLVVTLLAVLVLVVFYVSTLWTGAFSWDLLFTVAPDPGQSATWLPRGWGGVFAALPFAIWFYLAIEQLPLAAEETHDVVSAMPRALLLGIGTLLVLSLFTLVLNSGVGGGAAVIGASAAPLEEGFRAVFGGGATTTLLTIVALTGLVASFHTIIYAYGRVLFALSRAGYFPRWISVTGKNRTPYVALLLGGAIGFAGAVVIHLQEGAAVGAALLNMAVFGAVISYVLVMVSYIKLKIFNPDLPRPYVSPLGIGGAVVGVALALVALAACLAVPDYRPGVWGTVIFLAIAVVYFLTYSRNRLVAQAPEEEIALMTKAQDELAHK
ncbi:MAG: ethanolamine permease [Rhodothermales bacterium]|nr:ethanolamine permease [Rhodothermales bacterium]